jgi:hypothetical protein
VVGSNVTLDGGGATLWLPGTGHNARGISLRGNNIVLRNIRVRNSGDAIDCGGSDWRDKTADVLIERVTVSGSGDDGFALSYGCKNITLRWSAALGCTRAIFEKYGGTDVTIHHSIISHFWMRAPLVAGNGAKCDFRNNLVQHWQMTGTQPSEGALVNCVNGTYRFDKGVDKGKADCAIGTYGGGSFYSSGNQFVDCAQRPGFATAPLFEAPPINQLDDAATALQKVLSETDGAGCMPRDAIDKAYLALHEGWQAQPSNKGITHGLQIPETEAHLKGAK